MADCSHGPVSTMPGTQSTPPSGARCDTHNDRPAARRVQGETDSFGCEWLDLCAECVAEFVEHARQGRCGRCDWCKCSAEDLSPRRDYDEGMAGPVYQVCGSCRAKDNDRARSELADYDDYDDYFVDDDD